MLSARQYDNLLNLVRAKTAPLAKGYWEPSAREIDAMFDVAIGYLGECECFRRPLQHDICRQIHRQCAVLHAAARRALAAATPSRTAAAINAAAKLVDLIDRQRPTLAPTSKRD